MLVGVTQVYLPANVKIVREGGHKRSSHLEVSAPAASDQHRVSREHLRFVVQQVRHTALNEKTTEN